MTAIKNITAGFRRKLGYKSPLMNVTFIEWGVFIALFIFAFLSFHYVDLDYILDNTILFAKSIYHGEVLDFYEFSLQNKSTYWMANYEIIVYVIFAIWNLPIILANYIGNVDYLNSTVCVMWSKLLIVAFLLGICWCIYKLCRDINIPKDRSLFALFFFMSSTSVLFFTTIIDQCETIAMFFMLCGCRMLINKKYKSGVAFFAIAIPLKMFAVFIFVPLILLIEKRIRFVLVYLLSGVSLLVFCNILYSNSPAYKLALGSNSNAVFQGFSSFKIGGVPVFVTILVLICIFCYMTKPVNTIDFARFVFYIPVVVFGSFLLFYPPNTYWIVLILPFLTLTVLTNNKLLFINTLLETGISFSWVLKCALDSWAFANYSGSSEKAVLAKLFPVKDGYIRKYGTIANFLESKDLKKFAVFIAALFAACLIAFVIINFPLKIKSSDGNTEPLYFSLIWTRIALIFLLLLIVTYSFMKTTRTPSMSTLNSSKLSISQNILSDTHVEQNIVFSEDRRLDELKIMLQNNANDRSDISSINVVIRDADSKKEVFRHRRGTSLIVNNSMWVIDLKDTLVKSNQIYTIEIYGQNPNGKTAYLMRTESLIYEKYPSYVNNEKQNFNLYMEIN